jgi:putative phosphoribosyl transferase
MNMEATMTAPVAVEIPIPPFSIRGTVRLPEGCRGLVLLAQGSGASKPSARDQAVFDELDETRIGYAHLDLAMSTEEEFDADTGLQWSDVHFLAGRLVVATDWLAQQANTRELSMGYWGADSHAAVALLAAAARPSLVKAVVARDGRPDLVEPALSTVVAPTLLIVDGNDRRVLDANRMAMQMISGEKDLRLVRREATRLASTERGSLTAAFARDWFLRYLGPGDRPAMHDDRPHATAG